MSDDYMFEYLHMEIVEQLSQNCSSDKGGTGSLNSAIQKLEKLGFVVGQKFIERATKDLPRFKDELDAMKFICKEVWLMIFKKQIDNLRTNHHGVYNLHDYRFCSLERLSSGNQYKEHAHKYLAFPCGVLRGSLASLGYECIVTAEVTKMPSCKFLIQIHHT